MGQKDIKAKKQFSGSIGYRRAQLRKLRSLLRGSVGVADSPSCAVDLLLPGGEPPAQFKREQKSDGSDKEDS